MVFLCLCFSFVWFSLLLHEASSNGMQCAPSSRHLLCVNETAGCPRGWCQKKHAFTSHEVVVRCQLFSGFSAATTGGTLRVLCQSPAPPSSRPRAHPPELPRSWEPRPCWPVSLCAAAFPKAFTRVFRCVVAAFATASRSISDVRTPRKIFWYAFHLCSSGHGPVPKNTVLLRCVDSATAPPSSRIRGREKERHPTVRFRCAVVASARFAAALEPSGGAMRSSRVATLEVAVSKGHGFECRTHIEAHEKVPHYISLSFFLCLSLSSLVSSSLCVWLSWLIPLSWVFSIHLILQCSEEVNA